MRQLSHKSTRRHNTSPFSENFFLWICLSKSRETGTKKNLHIHAQRGTADNGQNELSPKDTVNNHCITS